MSFSSQDRTYMERALALAEHARGLAEPNPMVGAVLVKGGRVVGEGWTQPYGGPHAEPVALKAAGDAARGATLYATLEPCAHKGKTPPCAPAVVRAGVTRVVIAVLDPTAKTRRKGLELLQAQGVATETGLCREQAVRQNAAFFKHTASGMPLVTAKWAMTADGKLATRTGSSQWITGEAARRRVHEVRGLMDAVVVGVGTVLRDDPLLTCRDAERRRTAARVVLCGDRLPPPDCRLVRTAGEAPVLIACPEGPPPAGLADLVAHGCEALGLPPDPAGRGFVSPLALLKKLGARGMWNVLVEGGGQVLGSFLDAGLVDRVMAFIAPKVVGGAGAPTVGGHGVEQMADAHALIEPVTESLDSDLLIAGWLKDPLDWAPED